MPIDDALFHPVERTPAPRRIVEQFRQLIADRRLTPGSQFPSERELAHALGVGRSTMREAMRVLESMGLIETRPGQGTFLRAPSTPLTIIARPVLSCRDYRMVLEARRAVEPAIAGLAAARTTPDAVADLQRTLDDQARAIAGGSTGTAQDVAFHRGLSRLAGNPVLHHFYDSLEEVLRASREPLDRVGGRLHSALVEHRAVLTAVNQGNPSLAERRMLAHLEAVGAWAAALPCWCGTCAVAAD